MTVARPDSLHFELIAAGEARLATPVTITLRLTNISDRPLEAHFLGRTIAFDIVVTTEGGTIVWQRLSEGATPSILQIRTLTPGETLEWRDDWIPKAPGRYRLQGILPSDDPEPRRTPWIEISVRA